jgi:hypothetical protein
VFWCRFSGQGQASLSKESPRRAQSHMKVTLQTRTPRIALHRSAKGSNVRRLSAPKGGQELTLSGRLRNQSEV